MGLIIRYIRWYFSDLDKRVFGLVSLFTAILIYINYAYGVDDKISSNYSFHVSFFSRFAIFLLAFITPYLFYHLLLRSNYLLKPRFLLLVFLAPAIFAFKVALDIPIHFSDNSNWNLYWNHIFYWPVLVLITGGILFIVWRLFDAEQSFYGLTTPGNSWKPYWLMLLIMVPLIAAASTQSDFLEVYPRLKLIAGIYDEAGLTWWHKLIFELSYGSDFITIELFFRGFLILAFVKWAGKDAILPMACFYCTIHFGKPLGECISSYFGGIILGIVVFHTKSMLGGLMVHLGIAWLMELGGYIGNSLK